ncbi:hypothetical protein JRQ81_011640 [Phrynocephalus forsythii]|uniref:Uncharacterized protein n=1 Tax=Phrynocephalus forsythii TaxID=171643 RepID=A0A9Q0X689_9SAUR|nr:hypothetical protein JRQ81_011640 [Phrynocephalus forsythii]
MSSPKYKRMEENVLDPENPPPYSAKHPSDTALLMPPQYQPYSSPYRAESNQGPSQSILITQICSTHGVSHEPDYMAYSIFTMLCCCLPLGVAALVYSIQTQESNRIGNSAAARRTSRTARILAHTALGLGLTFLILYIIFFVITYAQVSKLQPPTISP